MSLLMSLAEAVEMTRDGDSVAIEGWPVRFADKLTETREPSAHELKVLREFHPRTRRAHGE